MEQKSLILILANPKILNSSDIACTKWKYFKRKCKAKGFKHADLNENFYFQMSAVEEKVIKISDFKTNHILDLCNLTFHW